LATLLTFSLLCGCRNSPSADKPSFTEAWPRTGNHKPAKEHQAEKSSLVAVVPSETLSSSESAPDIAAVIDGISIGRERLIQPLLRAGGARLFETIVILHCAARRASELGLQVGSREFDREHEQTLRQFADPLSSLSTGPFDPQAAEQILSTLLAERGISREEFRLVVERNAYLRAVTEKSIVVTEDELRREYERRKGRKAVVRHLQAPGAAAISSAAEQIAAGMDFAEAARRFSANPESARNGGLLRSFSEFEDRIPELFRNTAFSLRPGQVSPVIRIGPWFHLIRLEELTGADDASYESARIDLESELRQTRVSQKMQELAAQYYRDASVVILDPDLKDSVRQSSLDASR